MADDLMKLGESPGINLGAMSDVAKIVANLAVSKMSEFQTVVTEHITSPFNVLTPKDKIKRRPDGYDYVENTWMDKSFKQHSPLYSSELVHYSEADGWISIIVRVTDRLTGNSELGADSARIQVRQGAGTQPIFKDIIDKGNNIKSALSRAIKNAQSRFGHAADIYGKRESTKTEEERNRFDSILEDVNKISKIRAQQFEQGWNEIGVDFSDYLDRWQTFVERNSSKPVAEKNKGSVASDATVTTDTSHTESNTIAENKKQFVF